MSSDTCIPGSSRQSSSIYVPGGYSQGLRGCAFENNCGKMEAGNLYSSDRPSRVGRNDHESVWMHWRMVVQVPVARLLLIDKPTSRTLRSVDIDLNTGIVRKSERAPVMRAHPR